MAQQIFDAETRTDLENGAYGRVVARDVSADDYMADHAAYFREWIEGIVIDVSPVTFIHAQLVGHLYELLRAYFAFNRIGLVVGEPFVLRLDTTNSRREPDLQVILKTNPGQRTATAMIGAADICIEVVSEESVRRDYRMKLAEYEKNGVKEYWIIDPLHTAAHFYQLNDAGVYMQQSLDAGENYRTPLLPQLAIHVPTFWQEELPDIATVVRSVEAMLKKSAE